jgi:hypothetical protein
MDITLRIVHSEFPLSEVRDVVNYALRAETGQAKLRRDYYRNACHAFETEYDMSSDEFLARFASGEVGDDATHFDWYAAKQGFDIWDRRYRILSRVSI